MRATINGDVRYRFTGQEYDSETGLYNFRARLYDDELGIFYAVDPAGQNFSPFSYAGNNPVIFVDENGRWFGIDDLIAAAIGGVVNLTVNLIQGNVNNFWEGLGYFGAGAVAGDLALYGPAGWAAGGAIIGASNNLLQGGNLGSATVQGLIGGISGIAGGYAASWASANLGGLIVNGLNINANSAIAGGIFGSVGGVGGAFGGGFTTGLITTGDIGSAFEMGISGIPLGLTTGGITGFSSNISRNIANERNWFSGRPNQSVIIGETQARVDQLAEGIRSNTIKTTENPWPEGLEPSQDFEGSMRFNKNWINEQMQQGKYIYDAGFDLSRTIRSPFYNMESIQTQNYYRSLNIYEINPNYKMYYWNWR